VAIGECIQKFRLWVIAQLGSAQTPKARELSRWDVKKTGNGGKALWEQSQKPMWERSGSGRRSDEEAGTSNIDVE
jgi:hypothetical protein